MTVLVVLAGGLGAVCRFLVDSAARARLGDDSPVGIVAVNVVGSFVMGLLTGLVLAGAAPGAVLALAGSGFLGGWTTFSTATADVVVLLRERRYGAAAATAGGTLVLSVGAAGVGLAAAGALPAAPMVDA